MEIGSILPVGTIIHSMLTTTQFQNEYGTNWVLADGSSCTGTKYALVTGASNVPDMRGRFLRGKSYGSGNNPDGDLSLGAYTVDKYGSHDHIERWPSSAGSAIQTVGSPVVGASGSHYSPQSSTYLSTTQRQDPITTTSSGSNETAPKSITVNIFIRVN